MKKSLYFLLLSFLPLQLFAQTILFNDDFEKYNQSTLFGWGTTFTGIVPWQAGKLYVLAPCMGGPGMKNIAAVCECNMDRDNSDVLLYTKKINFTNVEGAWVSFDSHFNKLSRNGKTEKASVEVSTDSGHTWTVVDTLTADTASGYFQRHYVNLGAFDHSPEVRVGFRYSDDHGFLQGWVLDNVKVFIPAKNDIALIDFSPSDSFHSYRELGKGFKHNGRIFNAGKDTIYSYVINYQQAGKTIMRDSITGVAIPQFGYSDFVHKIPDTISQIPATAVTAWAELTGDTIHNNDSLYTFVRGAYFMPRKRVAIEEGTGTWNPWSPRGWVYMNQLTKDDGDPCLVSVHDTDPMEYEAYTDFLYNLRFNFVPYFLFDRRISADPDSFFTVYNKLKTAFGFADLSVHGTFRNDTLFVGAHVTPAIDLTGDLRFAVVLTEDSVTGSVSGYEQKNIYATGWYGAMGGFENKPNPIPANEMYYNFVARTAEPTPEGLKGGIPTPLLHNQTYHYYFPIVAKPEWNKALLRAVVMLVRYDDSAVLNSNKTMFYLDTKSISNDEKPLLYPNPSDNNTQLVYYTLRQEEVHVYITDISGRTLKIISANAVSGKNVMHLTTSELSAGLYIVNIISDSKRQTIKMQVVH